MELTLKVNDDVGRKIQGLSVLTGKTAQDITEDLSARIDSIITEQLLDSIGIQPALVREGPSTATPPIQVEPFTVVPAGDAIHTSLTKGSTEDGFSVWEAINDDDDDEEIDPNTEGLSNISVDDVDELDTYLPAEDVKELKETQMAVKDTTGNETGYEDELMADMQAMAEDDDGDFESTIMDDAAASMGSVRTGATVSTRIAEDTPVGDGGEEKLDILPADFNLDKVSENNDDAMGFFSKAISGTPGNKGNRNAVVKKKQGLIF